VVKGYTQVIFNGLTTLVLAWVIAEVIQNCSELSGIFHVGSEAISKYELLVCLRDAFNWDIAIEPCKSPRCDRSLDSSRFRHKTGIVVPSWDIMISELVASLGPGTIQNAPNPRENQLSFGQ
jgi:dTDP-4-dehydrorhamnose reductase